MMPSTDRDIIAAMIAELHNLYRDPAAIDLHARLDSVGALLDELREHVGAARSQPVSAPAVAYAPSVVSTDSIPSLADRLVHHIRQATTVRIASAFLSPAETNPLILPLRELTSRGGPVRILTSTMGFFNSPDALSAFLAWDGPLELRLYHEQPDQPEKLLTGRARAFHAKTLLIEKVSQPNVVAVGSANLTGAGFSTNVEWDYVTDFEVNVPLGGGRSAYANAAELFDRVWSDMSYRPDEAFLARYREIWQRGLSLRRRVFQTGIEDPDHEADGPLPEAAVPRLAPNPAQQIALKRMAALRHAGVCRYAVIAATGVGKTILSAFDVLNTGARRVLFLAHRRTILEHTRSDYLRVLGDEVRTSIVQGAESLTGLSEQSDGVHVVFAMVPTLGRQSALDRLPPEFFDYIVIDEFHHAAAETYTRILDHFEPRYLLGMTATPDRTDGQDVLAVCGRNVAYDVRVLEAVDRGWLTPFQYYAIHDPTDYRQIRWNGKGYDENELERALSEDTRADLIVRNLRLYQSSSGDRRALAFCSNVGHARWMAHAFAERGIPAEALTGETPEDQRIEILRRLEDPDDPLEVVCAVDVLNEGFDIPGATHILMLRPTQSFTVFLQQLGRGLRLHSRKGFVLVLDFVGNYRKSMVAPLVLNGYHSVPERGGIPSPGEFSPPSGCFVGADQEVVRIWSDAIRPLSKNSPEARLARVRAVLEELSETDASNVSRYIGDVRLPELFLFSMDREGGSSDIASDIKKLGGWLRARQELAIVSAYETSLIGTPGEDLLSHIEEELKPNKSYKMAVLHVLLDRSDQGEDSGNWHVHGLAPHFLAYYLRDRRRISDWKELSRVTPPEDFPLSKVVAQLKKMPLGKLSNGEDKPFTLSDGVFALKDSYREYWRNDRFRALVRERVEYAEARYWARQSFDDSPA